jgi:hypothetical protein
MERRITRKEPSLQLPDFPQVSTEALSAIVERHRLEAKDFSRLRNAGIFNEIYLLGSGYVLRAPGRPLRSSPPSTRRPLRCPPPGWQE